MNVSRQKDFERTLCPRVKTNWSSAQIGEEVVLVYTRHFHLFAQSTAPEKKNNNFKHMEKTKIRSRSIVFFLNILPHKARASSSALFHLTGFEKKIMKIWWNTY